MKIGIAIRIILTIVISSLTVNCINAQNNSSKKVEINLIINDSAVRYILENPQRAIIEKYDIWRKFKGYQIALAWHKSVSNPIDLSNNGIEAYKHIADHLQKGIEGYKKDTDKAVQLLKLLDDIKELDKKEYKRISQHLSSFIPTKESFNINVYFVIFTYVSGTSSKNSIMLRLEPNMNASQCLNTLIHEGFHTYFESHNINYINLSGRNLTTKKEFLEKMVVDMQNEGMATWLSYDALKFLPVPYKLANPDILPDYDYLQFEKDTCIRKAFKQINKIIQRTKLIEIDSLNKEAWDIGIMQRAYYLAGAYMSKTIEKKYGRKHLANLINKDEKVFVQEYNALATDEYKIKMIDY